MNILKSHDGNPCDIYRLVIACNITVLSAKSSEPLMGDLEYSRTLKAAGHLDIPPKPK